MDGPDQEKTWSAQLSLPPRRNSTCEHSFSTDSSGLPYWWPTRWEFQSAPTIAWADSLQEVPHVLWFCLVKLISVVTLLWCLIMWLTSVLKGREMIFFIHHSSPSCANRTHSINICWINEVLSWEYIDTCQVVCSKCQLGNFGMIYTIKQDLETFSSYRAR